MTEITGAQESAKQFLTENQGLVRFLVAQLVKKQSLTGEEFDALVKLEKGQPLSIAESEVIKANFRKLNEVRSTHEETAVRRAGSSGKAMLCKDVFKESASD